MDKNNENKKNHGKEKNITKKKTKYDMSINCKLKLEVRVSIVSVSGKSIQAPE